MAVVKKSVKPETKVERNTFQTQQPQQQQLTKEEKVNGNLELKIKEELKSDRLLASLRRLERFKRLTIDC